MKNNDNNIKFIGIANMIDKNVIVEYSQPGPGEKKSSVLTIITQFQSAVRDIIDKLILISITGEERHTETIQNNLKILTFVDKSVRWCFVSKQK